MNKKLSDPKTSKMILDQFNQKTRDGICAYVSLNIPKDEIPDNYLVIGIEKEDASSFIGVIVAKEKLYTDRKRQKDFSTLYLKMSEEASYSVVKTDNEWQNRYRIGVLNITTTIN